MTATLQGVRVLVVEDEYLVAALMENMLEFAGCVVAGPVSRLAQALDAANSEACDVAVLDVNLAGERVYPVAEILNSAECPFCLCHRLWPKCAAAGICQSTTDLQAV